MKQAILALDVYHRGYNSTGVVEYSPGVYDFVAKLADSSSANETLLDGVNQEDIGFYALYYTSKDDGDFVVYRGTDDGFSVYDTATDVRNGFGIGLGKPHGPQGKAAVDFYNNIVDLHGGGDPFNSPIQVTGQSLGGGLAGYVAALYDKDATIFAHMPYDLAAKNAYSLATTGVYPQIPAAVPEEVVQVAQALVDGELDANLELVDVRLLEGLRGDAWVELDAVVQMINDIYGDRREMPAPDIEGIESFHIKDEALYYGRLLACLNQEFQKQDGQNGSCERGSQDPIPEARIGHYIDSFAGAEHPSVAEKHFQSTFVINAFGYTDEVQDDAWQVVFPEFWPAFFHEGVGTASGSVEIPKGTEGLKQDWAPQSVMDLRIAYSVIDEGVKPQGDAAIRAIYDDAIELGRLIELGKAPKNLVDALPGLAQIIVQYGGQLARQEVHLDNPQHVGLDLDQGVVSFARAGERVPQTKDPNEGVQADMLLIDLSKERWNASDLAVKREKDLGPPLDPDRPVLAEGLDAVLDDLYNVRLIGFDNNSEFAKLLEWLYGAKQRPEPIPGDEEGKRDFPRAAPHIVRVDFALSDELSEVHLAQAVDAAKGLPPDQATLFVGNDSRQKIFGTNDNNIVFGGEDANIFVGYGGKDILVGRGGSDSFIDTIRWNAGDPMNARASFDDVYIGGDPVSFSSWREQFERRWGESSLDQEILEFLQFESDKVQYTLRTEPGQFVAELPTEGLVVDWLENIRVGDTHAVQLGLLDQNDGRVSTDVLINIDSVQLSERSDQLSVTDDMLQVPLMIAMGNHLGGPVVKKDWDEVSYADLTHGILMVNGTTQVNDPNGPLPSDYAGKLGTIAQTLAYFIGLPPSLPRLQLPGASDPLRVTGAEKLVATQYDDTLYFRDVDFLSELLSGWPQSHDRARFGEIDGGGGHDVIYHFGGEYYGVGDEIPEASGGAVEFGADSIAAEEMRLTIRGGEGDDRLLAANGEGTVLIGGDGRDFLFNTSYGGELYGDTVDGVGQSTSGPEDADVFWFWPGTFIMDAQPNDSLEMFGLPLLGGTNALTGYHSATGGGLAQDWVNWSTFYGETTSGQLFVYNPILDMVVNGDGTRPPTRMSQVQTIENFDFGGYRSEQFGVPAPGDLGLTFRFYLPPGNGLEISLFNSVWGDVISSLDALERLAKRIRWQPAQDPLVLDLDGDGIETTSLTQSRAYFDLNVDYFRDRTGWLAADDGFLVLDVNQNGIVDDATELIGGPDLPAFTHLTQFDAVSNGGNADGVLTAADALYSQFQVWRDLDQDGISAANELWSLADLEIASLDLTGAELVDTVTPQGATLLAVGGFTRTDGSRGTSYEAIFEIDSTDTIFRGDRGLAEWLEPVSSGPPIVADGKGFGSMPNLATAASNDFALAEIVQASAAAMTTPNLDSLRQAATPVFGAWSQTLERTRELTPVLVELSDGGVQLADYGIYQEDADGGFWTLRSGRAVVNALGETIARPRLAEVLAQAATGNQAWRLEQAFSPASRSQPLAFRSNTAYLSSAVEGRRIVHDYATPAPGGGWQLATLRAADGGPLVADTLESLMASVPMTAPAEAQWQIENLGYNRYADLPVDRMGVQLVDGTVVDYTVQVSDVHGDFHVWARNLDRALELQRKYNSPQFPLRNYEVNLDALDATGSTDDSAYRVEILTAGQFHFASSIFGIDFQPQVMYAITDPITDMVSYSVGSFAGEEAPMVDEDGNHASAILPAIEMFDGLMQNYIDVSRGFAVRWALQGGLFDFARELGYTASTDEFRATGERELAPMFEAIFASAPPGAQEAYDYLVAWDEILEVVYPDYHLNESKSFVTGTMLRDQAFVFQMLLPAFETIGIDADLPAVLHALGVDETKLITHDVDATVVQGTSGPDYFYVSSGNQTYQGGDDADIYFVGQNFGQDVIEDVEMPLVGVRAPDQLRFTHAKSTDVVATRDGLDLVLSVIGTGDVLRVKDQFEGENIDPLLGNDISPDTEMVSIVFADGVIWERFQIAEAVSAPRDTDDLVQGTQTKDILRGGRGNDVMRGGRDGDTYIYWRGDGDDRIDEDNDRPSDDPVAKSDLLQFAGGIRAKDLQFFRDGESQDVEIRIRHADGQPSGDRLYLENQFAWIDVPILGLIFPDSIERLVFDDGSFLSDKDVMQRVLREATSDQADVLYGFHHPDRLDGGRGDDVLIGRAQNDTYVFGEGYGHDVVSDRDDDLFWESHDAVEFHDGLRWSDFEFLREGASPTITLRVLDTGDSLTLEDQFKNFPLQGFINRIEQLTFADGTQWDWAKLGQYVVDLAVTSGDDLVYGFDIDDRMDGGPGNDRLEGGAGADTYVFARGYGHDKIFDASSADQGDVLVLQGISLDDVDLSRAGLDLILTIRDTGETLALHGQYARNRGQPHAIETLRFADAEVDFRDLGPAGVDLVGTDAGETLEGTDFGERIDGRGGDDTLVGRSDGDTYLFDVGYGHDVIVDQQTRVAWMDREGSLQKEGDDRVQFGGGMSPAQVEFTRQGQDLVISVANADDSLRVQNQFRAIEDGVEWFVFADGSTWHISDIEERLAVADAGWGDDVLQGTPASANVLDGRQGDDQLIGGHQADTYVFGAAYDLDKILESETPVAGALDRVVFSASVVPDTVQLRRDAGTLILDLGNGEDQLTIVDGLTTRQVELFSFADGTLWTIEDVRRRLLTGTDGDDRLVGFDDRDDVLQGFAGTDWLEGGRGNDEYFFEVGSRQDAIFDTGGVDRLRLGPTISPAMLRLSNVRGSLLVQLHGQTDSVIIHGGVSENTTANRIEQLVFHDGTVVGMDDLLRALIADSSTPGDDVIDARLGVSVQLAAGRGNDLILGQADTTLVFSAGDGSDVFDTSHQLGRSRVVFQDLASTDVALRRVDLDGPDVLLAFPQTGDQLLVRSAMNHANLGAVAFADGVTWTQTELVAHSITAQATDRNDVITGSSGDDQIRGLHGDDDIEGGFGDDTYFYDRGDGRDRIQDVRGRDMLELRGYRPSDVTVSLPVPGRSEVKLHFAGSQHDEIILPYGGLTGVDVVRFGDGTEWTLAELQSMAIGQGTTADDQILGNAESNTLRGGHGNDWLQGDAGHDTYVFERGGGRDIIDDHGRADDINRLVVRDYVPDDLVVVTFEDRVNDLTLRFGDGDEVIIVGGLVPSGSHIAEFLFEDGTLWSLEDIRDAELAGRDAERDETLTGSMAADVLVGEGGDDRLSGRDGSDRYVYRPGDGHDVIEENGQYDTDVVRIEGYDVTDATFGVSSSSYFDLVVEFPRAGDRITIVNTLEDVIFDQIEVLEFASATGPAVALTMAEIRERVLAEQQTAGDDRIRGYATSDTLEAGPGRDRLLGRDGSDTYVFRRGQGLVIVDDNGDLDDDVVRVEGYALEHAVFRRSRLSADDLIIGFQDGDGDEITIVNTLNGDRNDQIESLVFISETGDETSVLTMVDVRQILLDGQRSAGDDRIEGYVGPDQLAGGPGDDYLSGGDGSDAYQFARGDGVDTIVDAGNGDTDVLRIFGYTLADALFSVADFDASHLWIQFVDSGDQILVAATMNANPENVIETFVFDGVTPGTTETLTIEAVRQRVADAGETFAYNRIAGTDATQDELRSGPGSDWMSGKDQSDTYVFAAGGGQDIIEEHGFLDDDVLRIEGYTEAEVMLSQDPLGNLLVRFANSTDQVLIARGASGGQADRVEKIVVGNVVWDETRIRAELLRHQTTDGRDLLEGSFTNDVLSGGRGDDVLHGRDGSDVYVFQAGDGHDIIEDDGFLDSDSLRIEGWTVSDMQLSRDADDLILEFAGSTDRIDVLHTLNLSSQDQIERIEIGGQSWDMNRVRQELLRAEAERDGVPLTGFASDDILQAGPGPDRISGYDGSDTYVFHVGDGHDTIEDDGFFDTDVVQIVGYTTSDVRTSRARHAQDNLILTFPGQQDRIEIVNTLAGSGQDQIELFQFDDQTWTIDQIMAQLLVDRYTDFDDVLLGTDVGETLMGGWGNDQLRGGRGHDIYRYRRGDGYDVVSDPGALEGHGDLLRMERISPQHVALQRGLGSDLEVVLAPSGDGTRDGGRITVRNSYFASGTTGISGIVFDDGTTWSRAEFEMLAQRSVATVGADRIEGTTGHDRLLGLHGNDRVHGYAGDDVYVFGVGDGQDLIRDAGSGNDRIEIRGYSLADTVFARQGRDSQDLVIQLGDTGDQITVINTLSTSVPDQIEIVYFADTQEQLTMEEIRQRVVAGNVSDGVDQILGTDFSDTLTGGGGADLLIGRDGQDRFIYAQGDGDVRVTDGGADAFDEVQLPDFTTADLTDVHRSPASGFDLVLQFANLDRLTLTQSLGDTSGGIERIVFADGEVWSIAAMRAATLAFAMGTEDGQIRGFAGADALAGGPGNDLLIGGDGPDGYRFRIGDGHDVIDDQSQSRGDEVIIEGYASVEASVTRLYQGSDSVVVKFAGGMDSLTLYDVLATTGAGVEAMTFADDVTWSQQDLLRLLDNHPPVARDDGIFAVRQDHTLYVSTAELLRNDFDADGDPLEILSVHSSDGASVRLGDGDNVEFTPVSGFAGITAFVYTVRDPAQGLATASVAVRVNPLAAAHDDDGLQVAEDGVLSIPPNRLLANDTDGDRMVISQVLDAQHGAVSFASSGTISFVPDPDFVGTASFRYVANTVDGGRAEATVAVEVLGVNDAPRPGNDPGFVTDEQAAFEIETASLLANDVDVDGDAIVLVDVRSSEELTVELQPNGTILVTPAAFFFGRATFEYVVQDALQNEAVGMVAVDVMPVNDPPAPELDRLEIQEDEPILISLAELLENDTDYDGDNLDVVSVRPGTGGLIEWFRGNRSILFTPAKNWFGQASFFYTIDDGHGAQATTGVAVQVNPVNDAPTPRDEFYSTENVFFLNGFQNTPLTIAIADLLQNDIDVDSLDLTLVGVSDSEHGVAEIDGDDVVFVPTKDYWGEASFRYVVKDDGGLVGDAKVTLYFAPTQDAPPVAVDDHVTMTEDVTATIAAAGLLGNDLDLDQDGLQIQSVAMRADFGTARINEAGDVVVTPALNLHGLAFLDYTVTDNADGEDVGRVTIDILSVNDAPTAARDFATTRLDVPLVLRISELMSNDNDVDLKPDQHELLSFVDVRASPPVSASVYQDEFIVVNFPTGFTGQATLQYSIADQWGAEGDGTVDIVVQDMRADLLEGSSQRDLIYGTPRADTIDGRGGDDDLYGGLGDDVLRGGDGADRIDGGPGMDTVDLLGSGIGVRADLAARIGQGGFAQGDEYFGIEELMGTMYDDLLAGDAGDNVLVGRAGDDYLIGRDGRDELVGGEGDDVLAGGPKGDQLNGGPGSDTVDYRASLGGVRISLTRGSATGADADEDLLLGIENMNGSEFDDVLIGSATANRLFGNRGRDILRGGAGPDVLSGGRDADQLHGGPGFDRAEYRLSESGISLNLLDPWAGGGDARGDVLTSIEMVVGSAHDDVIIGDDRDNVLVGGLGADVLDAGLGFDTLSYEEAGSRVVIDLGAGVGTTGEAQGDVLRNFEKLIGSAFHDVLTGSNASETFDGGSGDDVLAGAAGSDTYLFGFGSGNDQIVELGELDDIDVVRLGDAVRRRDVSVRRDQDDLWIDLERRSSSTADSLRIENHFLGPETGVEQLMFADGAIWDRSAIQAFLQAGAVNASDDIVRFATEDEPLVIGPDRLLRNDADGAAVELQIVAVGNAENAAVVLQDDGSVLFRAQADFHGDAFFEYTVRAPNGRESTARVEVNVLAVNDPPVAANDGPWVGQEDTPLAIPIAALLENDFDVDGDGLVLTSVFGPLLGLDGQPLHQTLIGTNGEPAIVGDQVVFTPAVDHFGFAGFRYQVADPSGEVATAEVELHFEGANDAPRTMPDRGFVRLGRTESIRAASLMFNDVDPEGDSFRVVEVLSASNGTVRLRAVPEQVGGEMVSVTWIDFDAESLGPASYAYRVEDIWGATSLGIAHLNVIPLNDPPIARDDRGFATIEDQPILIDPAVLLQNDIDPENEPLAISEVERFPQNGTVRFDDQGMIAFTPRANYNGPAGFTYTVSDGHTLGTDTAFVHVHVGIDNDGPVVADDVLDGVEDEPIRVLPGEAFRNDVDPEGDLLFFDSARILGVLSDDFSPRVEIQQSHQHDLLNVSRISMSSAANGGDGQPPTLPNWLRLQTSPLAFERIPEAPFDGSSDAFTVLLNVAFGPDQPESVVPVRIDPRDFVSGDPVPVKLRALRGGETGSPELVTASLWNGAPLPDWLVFDSEQLELRMTDVAPGPEDGPVRVRVSYPPGETSVAGQDAATENAFGWDGRAGFAVEFWVDPAEELNPAVHAWLRGDAALAGPEGTVRSWMLPPDATISASSALGTPMPEWLEFDSETLTFSGLPPEKFVGVVPVRIDVGASVAAKSPPLAILTQIPVDTETPLLPVTRGFAAYVDAESIELIRPLDFTGTFVVEYRARDDKGTVSSESARIYVNVEPRRERPTPLSDSFEVDENGQLRFVVGDLLENDTDGDGDTLRLVQLSEPTHGTLQVEPSAVTFTRPNQSHLVQPVTHRALLADGSELPEWLVFDEASGEITGVPPMGARVDLTVYVVSEDSADPPRQESTRHDIRMEPLASAVAVYTPPLGYSGPVELSYEVTDDLEGPATGGVVIHVLPRFDPPVANEDAFSTKEDVGLVISQDELLANDFDVDGDLLRIVAVNAGEHSTVQLEILEGGRRQIRFEPEPNFDGTAWFEYTVTDDRHGNARARVDVNVTPDNRSPVANVDRFDTSEDTPLVVTIGELLGNDWDPDGDALQFVEVEQTGVDGNAFLRPDGSYDLAPRGDFAGEVTFTYTIFDGRLTSLQTGNIVLTVASVNDAPRPVDDLGLATQVDKALAIPSAFLLANDVDVDGDAIRLTRVLEPVNGTVELRGDEVIYVPRPGFAGNGGFVYEITDSRGASGTAWVAIDIRPNAGSLPVAVSDAGWIVDEDHFVDIRPEELLANDVDLDGDPLRLVGVSGLGVTQWADGTIRYTPPADANGRFVLNYQITDGDGPSVTGHFIVDVRPVPDNPRAEDDDVVGVEDAPLVIPIARLEANDVDVDGHPIDLTSVGPAFGGTVELDGVGNVRFVPERDRTGRAGFTYTLTDSTGAQDTATVRITLQPVNDPPLASPDYLTTSQDNSAQVDLLANDRDVDGNLDRASLVVVDMPASGKIYRSSHGTFTYVPDIGFVGEDRFRYLVRDTAGAISAPATVSITVEARDTVRPEVVGVFVDSDAWSSVFRDFVDDGFGGTSLGARLPLTGTSVTLPWFGMNIMRVQFSEDIGRSLDASDFVLTLADDYTVRGATGTVQKPSIGVLQYDAASYTATLGFRDPLGAGVIDFVIRSAGVEDAAGNPLEGRTVADDFSYRMFVLPGDVDGSGKVDAEDARPVRTELTSFLMSNFAFQYAARADVDGRYQANPAGPWSVIDMADLELVLDRQESSLVKLRRSTRRRFY